jgi:hypothetical protein
MGANRRTPFMSATRRAERHLVKVLRTEEPTADRRFRAWSDLVATACGPRHVHRTAEGAFDGAMTPREWRKQALELTSWPVPPRAAVALHRHGRPASCPR